MSHPSLPLITGELPSHVERPRPAPPRPAGPRPAPELVERLNAEVELVRGAPLGQAEQALTELDNRLSHEVMRGLDEIEDLLGEGLDLAEPLARTLRFGIPGELGWPAFEEAVAEIGARDGGIQGMTSTWPVLTVYGRDAAVAVDHRGRRGSCEFTLPEETDRHTVHFVGGDFQVGWTYGERSFHDPQRTRAFWCSDPENVFDTRSPAELFRSHSIHSHVLGLVMASPDGGRYDGGKILRPGSRRGVTQVTDHVSDGTRVWSSTGLGHYGFTEIAPETGARGSTSHPDFLRPDPELGYIDYLDSSLHLVRLPEGVDDSPLGSKDGLTGFRLVWAGPRAEGDLQAARALEGTDGRYAEFVDVDLEYWGILRMPENTSDGLLARTGHNVVQCRDPRDDSLLWRTWTYPKAEFEYRESYAFLPLVPPPAYWHFLTPLDEASSRVLRRVDADTARRLIDAALTTRADLDTEPSCASVPAPPIRESAACQAAVREALARLLPEITDETLIDGPGGVVWAVLWAADLRVYREELSRRTELIRGGAVVRPEASTHDRNLESALSGLFNAEELDFHHSSHDKPSTITAVAADGAWLSGRADERARRLSPPGKPARWDVAVGHTDALLWYLATGSPATHAHKALSELLRTWAEQPFARKGSGWVRGRATGAALAPLLEAGEAVITEPPVNLRRVGAKYTHHWSGTYLPKVEYTYIRVESSPAPKGAEELEPVRIERDEAGRIQRFLELVERQGALPPDPQAVAAFRATTRVTKGTAEFVLSGRLGREGDEPDKGAARTEFRRTGAKLSTARRCRIFEAAVPDDPAELWRPGGAVAAAERMARVWVDLLGAMPTKAEVAAAKARTEVPDLFAAELKMDSVWGDILADPSGHDHADQPRYLVQRRWGELEVRAPDTDRKIYKFHDHARPFQDLATVLAWAVLQAPVGHPVHAGVRDLHDRFSARSRCPEMYVPLGSYISAAKARAWADKSGAAPVLVGAGGGLVPGSGPWPTHSDGVLVLPDPGNQETHVDAVLLTSGLFDSDAVESTLKVLDDVGMDGAARQIRRAALLYDGRLARMAARVSDTPVPPGGFEADPRQSVPELVEEVAGKLGVDADAAALYLQLLTLARPTDRNIRRWNGWSPAHHKAVSARLLAAGVVQQGKRSRAGRTLFLPGGWTEIKAPHLPLETAKLAAHLVEVKDGKEIEGPFTAIVPVAPLHEMFAQAWQERGTS